MKSINLLIEIKLLIVIMIFSIFTSHSQSRTSFDENQYYRLTSQWRGSGLSLDILNSGKKNQPILAKTANVSGQFWKIKKVGINTYTLSTQWRGSNKILDCVQGPNKNRPILNTQTGRSGGAWKIISLGNGYFRITNLWLSDSSLDIINDGKNNKIQVAKTGNYLGQAWKITAINSSTNKPQRKWSNNSTLRSGASLLKGSSIQSPNKQYQLKFQKDGNLAFYGPNNRYIWDAKTNGKGVKCTLQNDGNLVVYDKYNKPVWSTETMSYFDRKYASRLWKPVKLEISNSGICALKSSTNKTVWTCGRTR
ncbi:hypothetical protein MC378_10925 [Polaribacter sp. MSW13]|uniref:Bulb-type lectin domain-containing protein n=1 Tax=Polaribacter marinus TaxID=2916838 RepID=A0A9X2AN98_9FLAO|nr:hypothetical protein [Polaribacter marinus]MCI2229679.1 hypothetical protein [Polaribacter marinus]